MTEVKNNARAVTLAIVITAIVIGGGVYVWQKGNLKAEENSTVTNTEKPLSAISTDAPSTIKFPVVVYGRAGLLNNTTEGRAEKKQLEAKLVSPYTDYYNEVGVHLVTMYIKVPERIGEAYDVIAIFGSGVNEEFGFGNREQVYGYWKPECMGSCDFSDAFKLKYPQIAE